MELRSPKIKRLLPWQTDSVSQYPASLEKLAECAGKAIIGKYNGSNVVVEDPNFIQTVYNLGCYGKGSLSRGQPNYSQRISELRNICPENDEERKQDIQNETVDLLASSSFEMNSSRSIDAVEDGSQKEVGREAEIPIPEDHQLKSELRDEFQYQESLHLNLEEAFFLSYALGCLEIVDLFDKKLSLLEAWRLFCESQDDFVQKYLVYHHYRSKGWVVKPGLKFGGDFILYKYGPHVSHASYIIVIEVIKEDGNISEEHQQPITWGRFISLNRMAESAGKEVLLSRVLWPNDVLFNDVQSPDDLKKFKIVEVLTRRWISSQERELAEKEEIGEESNS